MFSVDGYLVDPGSIDFMSFPMWDATIYGNKLFWAPSYPYLTAEVSNSESRKIIEQISTMIEYGGLFSKDNVMKAGASGIEVRATLGSPYAVKNAIEFIYGGLDDDGVVFSENAPTFYDDLSPEEINDFQQGNSIT